jgi:hypothetical protein
MNDTLTPFTPTQMIPGDFAEKAMASLMQMHSELMDEKERRVELYRKLMEREQALAELRMYVKLLEEKQQAAAPAPAPPQPQQHSEPILRVVGSDRPVVPPQSMSMEATPHLRDPYGAPPMPPRVARPKIDGWKTW